MSSPYAFRRAAWLVEFLLNREGAQLKEIVEAWRQSGLSDGEQITRQSWKRVMNRITDVFGIDIECEPRGSHDARYYISNPRVIRGNALGQWMMKCLHMKMQILDAAVIHDSILLEDFPSENGNYIPIKNAIYYNVMIEFDYTQYGKHKPKHHIVQPYCIKTYKYRYYVLGRFDSGRFCMFSFDRMENVVVTPERFVKDAAFNAEAFFKQYFGVYIDDKVGVQDIIVRAYGDAQDYLRDVPLHHSQKELTARDGVADFYYRLVPTNDFKGSILQQGNRIEVLAPPSLRKDIMDRIEAMHSRYCVQE